ncbi:hypothetical protein [Franconibacter pulveris]|uniref:hypothetical protein n=1 Tax=Franconibacter pulveris TaxID=435910 RepID=UPI00128EB998|nr:hypothetical protein [Franconibacter pulveris]
MSKWLGLVPAFLLLACQIVKPATDSKMMCIKAVIQSAAKAVTHHDDDHKQQRFNALILKLFLLVLCAFPGVGQDSGRMTPRFLGA